MQFLSVNRGGSTPPVAADITPGAALTSNAAMIIRARVNAYYNGISFVQIQNGGSVTFNDVTSTADKTSYFQGCVFY